QVKNDRVTESQQNREREAAFLADKENQAALLAEAKQQLAFETQRGEQLKATFDANDQKLAELADTLRQRSGSLGEMFGVVRQFSGEFKG
ncbi:hypothetical protein ACXWPW_09960, partial [Streptococcus pyogenes]